MLQDKHQTNRGKLPRETESKNKNSPKTRHGPWKTENVIVILIFDLQYITNRKQKKTNFDITNIKRVTLTFI